MLLNILTNKHHLKGRIQFKTVREKTEEVISVSLVLSQGESTSTLIICRTIINFIIKYNFKMSV